jgi:hypothetical protein
MAMLMCAPHFPSSSNIAILTLRRHRTAYAILQIGWACRLSSGSLTRSTGALGPWLGTLPSRRRMLMPITACSLAIWARAGLTRPGDHAHTRVEQFLDAGCNQQVLRYNALLCHDLKSYSLFSSFFAVVHRSHWCCPQQDSSEPGDELLLAHLPGV